MHLEKHDVFKVKLKSTRALLGRMILPVDLLLLLHCESIYDNLQFMKLVQH